MSKSERNGSMVFTEKEPFTVKCNVQPAATDNLNRSSSTITLIDGVLPAHMVRIVFAPGVYPDILHAKIEYMGRIYSQKGPVSMYRMGTKATWYDQIAAESGNAYV
ncbi:hypothetical protein ACN082_09780 [Rothia sp. CCM 9417]|uniref:hypothetical protein n=1 Tax=Rothia sp. CCM 9417 TaxID=3402657 RepID=UPI003AE895BC